MKIGYVRVSTEEQNTVRQEAIMSNLGVEKIYIEKISGKSKERPQLIEMLDFVREGDIVIVESISRFARNTKDLLELVETLKEKKVEFVSVKENIDTSTPTGQFMLTVFGAMAQLERDTILQRQKEGIAIAKAQGKYKGRKPISVDKKKFEAAYADVESGKSTNKYVMKELGLKPNTYYRIVKEYKTKTGAWAQ